MGWPVKAGVAKSGGACHSPLGEDQRFATGATSQAAAQNDADALVIGPQKVEQHAARREQTQTAPDRREAVCPEGRGEGNHRGDAQADDASGRSGERGQAGADEGEDGQCNGKKSGEVSSPGRVLHAYTFRWLRERRD